MHARTRSLAAIAGGLFAVTAAIDIPHEQATEFSTTLDYVLEATFAAALTVAALALWTLLGSATSWGARAGWGLALLGNGTLAVVATATLVSGREVLDLVFPLGLLAMLLGYVVLSVTDLMRRVTPRFAGLALALCAVAMIVLGDGYGVIAWSAGWFAVAALASTPARSALDRAPNSAAV